MGYIKTLPKSVFSMHALPVSHWEAHNAPKPSTGRRDIPLPKLLLSQSSAPFERNFPKLRKSSHRIFGRLTAPLFKAWN